MRRKYAPPQNQGCGVRGQLRRKYAPPQNQGHGVKLFFRLFDE
jgi:hypothetical protein